MCWDISSKRTTQQQAQWKTRIQQRGDDNYNGKVLSPIAATFEDLSMVTLNQDASKLWEQ